MKIRPLHAEYSTRSWVVAPQVLPAESLGVATSVSSCRESILPSVATASPRPARPTNAKGGAKTPPCKFIAQCAMRSTLSYYAPSGAIFAPRISIGLANTTGNQEQVAALPRRQRLIAVPYRSAATPPKAAQKPQSGVWHQNGGAQPHSRSPLPRAGQASQTSPDGETSAPEGRNPAARRNT